MTESLVLNASSETGEVTCTGETSGETAPLKLIHAALVAGQYLARSMLGPRRIRANER